MSALPIRVSELLLSTCAAVALVGSISGQTSQLPELAWTERSDWINVKTEATLSVKAMGDGSTDDTDAINEALSEVVSGGTVYFPPGTYVITDTITLNGGVPRFGVNLVGHGRTSTVLWGGEAGGRMLQIDGNPYGRYTGLILDGRHFEGLVDKSAATGFYHHNATNWYETSIRYEHIGLYGFTDSGIYADPNDLSAMAETSYENCIFDHCETGMRIGGFNDYNHSFAGCDFIACGTGIYSQFGSNFVARDCYFSESRDADIWTRPQHGCSLRRCKSVGSEKFLYFDSQVGPCVVQDCYISGWKSMDGAITQGSTPMALSFNRFVDAPDGGAAPPVRCTGPVVRYNNTAESSTVATGSVLYTVPVGPLPYAPLVGSVSAEAISTFVDQTVAVPPVVFDAVGFGHATPDDGTDDRAQIQATIDAARTAGGGAIAYIPRGTYMIGDTLTVTGSDYVVGGCGYSARLKWVGQSGGTMMRVTDPSNVRLENLLVGHLENGDETVQNNAIDIEQISTGAESMMTYEGVYVAGKNRKLPNTKGLVLNGLQSNCTVLIGMMEGNLRLIDSADARVIGNVTHEGAITVDGPVSAVYGFAGFMMRTSTANDYGVYVRNDNSLVLSDWYYEQSDNGILLSGDANPYTFGRVTIQGAKSDFWGSPNAQLMTINDYQGSVFYGANQPYTNPPPPTLPPLPWTQTISADGPVSIVLWGNVWCETLLGPSVSNGATLTTLANQGFGAGSPPPDNHTPQTLTDLTLAFGDLQRLGIMDLMLNFPHVFPVPSFSLPTGKHIGNQVVTLSVSTPGGGIRYTTDGSTPSPTNGITYSAPVSITQDTILKAVAYTVEGLPSEVSSATYQIWQTQNVGSVGQTGSASSNGSTFTVAGAGAGITGTADAFRYVYRQISGDCTIIARVVSCTSSNADARAGVMMRGSLTAGSIEASSLLMPKNSRAYFHRRTAPSGSTTTSNLNGAAAPYWVKLVRTGNTLQAYKSANGTSWTQITPSATVVMANPIDIGLAVTSGTTSAALTATFDNVSISP